MRTMLMSCVFGMLVIWFSQSVIAGDSVVLSNGEWKPYLSKELKHFGVASHIVTESFKITGHDVEYKWYGDSWKRAYKDALDGKVDGSLIWSKKEERLKEFFFSDSVISGERDVFVYLKKNAFDWNDISDLKGKRVGGVLGYTYGQLDQAEKEGTLVLDRVANEPINLKKLLKGRIDLFLVNEEIGKKLISELPDNEKELIAFHPKAVNEKTYHLILTKAKPANTKLIKDFNMGLKQLKDNGTYDQYLKNSKEGKYEK